MNQPHRPKAVVFDLGNVLLDFDYLRTVQKIRDHCTLLKTKSDRELLQLIGGSELFQKFEHGLINPDEFFAGVVQQTGYGGTLDEFGECFGDIFTEAPQMLAWNEELRAKGIPRYILSNTNDLSIRFIKKRFPFFNQFDGYVLSYKHRVMKPQTRIYELVEEMAGLRGNDLFYVDDRDENIHAAAARGWQAVLHVNSAQTLEIARGVGL
jgi:FMN phosphatase YigB (HAD superfamily)